MLDYVLINRPYGLDDENLSYDRLIGDSTSNVICFLPWRVSLGMARRFGILPSRFLASYEVPDAIVSSEPDRCVEALERLVGDALALLQRHGAADASALLFGLSIGTAPATVLANRIGARLFSVTSADRGDLLLWESLAARAIRSRAERKGYALRDFSQAFAGRNPIENLANLRPDSIFVSSDRDLFVPADRGQALIEAVSTALPEATIVKSRRGHARTILASARQLEEFLAQGTDGNSGTIQTASRSIRNPTP